MAILFSIERLIRRLGITFVFLLLANGILVAQLPTVSCTFEATLPLVPCVSNFSTTINYNDLPPNTQVDFIFPNTVSANNGDAQISPAGQDGQFYSGIFSLTGSGQFYW